MYCWKCGEENADQASCCTSCGEAIRPVAPAVKPRPLEDEPGMRMLLPVALPASRAGA